MWFTENPWPPVVLLVVAAIVCAGMWRERRASWWLVAVLGCLASAAGVVVFERSIVTPGEQIQQNILDLAQAFEDRNEDRTLDFVSARADNVRSLVRLGFATVTKVEHLRITDTSVTMLAAGSRAKLHFRANGTVTVRQLGEMGHQPTRWEMTWQQEGDQWKVIDIQRLNTMTGEPQGFLDAGN